MEPSRRSQRGLDWFAFFLADVQTGWGPFVAAYLTSVAWSATRHRADPDHRHAGRPRSADSRRRAGRSRARQALCSLRSACSRSAAARSCSRFGRPSASSLSPRCCTRSRAASSGRCSPRSASGWSAMRLQRPARTQRPLPVARQRDCRRRDGRLGLLFLQSGDLLSHRGARHPDTHRAGADPAERDRSRSGARRRAQERSRLLVRCALQASRATERC